MNSRLFGLFGLGIILLAALPACSQPVSGDVLRSDKQRISAPGVNQPDMDALVKGNAAFAFDLYRVLKEKGGNMFLSPYSISLALAMTYAGAKGATESDMAKTLDFNLPQDRLHPAFNSLDQELSSRGKGAKGKDGKGFRLNIVNAIWGQKGYQFLAQYLDLLAQNYGAGLRTLDFQGAPDGSRQVINQWVSDQTESRIKDLIPQGAIDSLTRLVLTNAIYFNAAWANPFDKVGTQPGSFTLSNGSQVTVPMMHQSEGLSYATGEGFQAVELPYDGNELSMLVVLPDAGKFEQVENGLSSDKMASLIGSFQRKQVALAMPQFKFESEFGLNDALSKMGMAAAFTDQADFSGMTGKRDLYISDVIHKAFVAVDEAGTEAAAATAVVMRATAMPVSPIEVTLNRPFIFLIRDIKTGSVLFLGRIMKPSA
jgi:serpin B